MKPMPAGRGKQCETCYPNVYAGKIAEAKAIAGGIQAERMKQMKGAMACK
ncbi:MAG: hypothetical protein Q7W53_03455 [Pseudomonadota bacterium]|nr:hypothetical protein [Pseudomonadota bacterium]